MDYPDPIAEENTDPGAIIVKADEVDEAGSDISAISPEHSRSESDFNARIESRRAQDAQSSPKILANAVPLPPHPLSRPVLKRESSAPAPPQQPPPPAPPRELQRGDDPNAATTPTDSLSLFQLKRLVADIPKLEPKAYAYEYEETRSFPEELQEWFSYSEDERLMTLRAKDTFENEWSTFIKDEGNVTGDEDTSWHGATQTKRQTFLSRAILEGMDMEEASARLTALACACHIALGVWEESAGLMRSAEDIFEFSSPTVRWLEAQKHAPVSQLQSILEFVPMLASEEVVQRLVTLLWNIWNHQQEMRDRTESLPESPVSPTPLDQLEAHYACTTLYVLIEFCRWRQDEQDGADLRKILSNTEPNLLLLLAQVASKLRWDDMLQPFQLARRKTILLLWKTMLVVFGSSQEVEKTKRELESGTNDANAEKNDNFITASPLDYHLFRQEIISKYPAYNPPPPLLPIEPENNTMLPPLPNHHSRQASQDNLSAMVDSSGSIFNKPVHIATPAPSPPPSPAGPGGKGGKKQNYQTNQNFPFLYPPFEGATTETSGVQKSWDQLVERRFERDEVPASILEAGQLFASRMRMSRSAQQLWNVREHFIKEERGWGQDKGGKSAIVKGSHDGHSPQSNDAHSDNGIGGADEQKPQTIRRSQPDLSQPRKETDDEDVQGRLDAVHLFYRTLLPDLQSLIIVLWKELFNNVSALVASSQSGIPNGIDDGGLDGGMKRRNANSSASLNALANEVAGINGDGEVSELETLDQTRATEITSKAVSGIILLLLKWFKVTHILQYEYLAQLLLDANYLPLILKYFAHQDIDKAVEQKNDRDELDFFTFCQQHSSHPPDTSRVQQQASDPDSSEDEAVPPPIRKHRRSPSAQSPPHTPPPPPPARPEVDELGFPISGMLPQTPLTNFAPRFFLTNINLLRILQKMTKRKAHRALLLVQYKSSTILRKALKIPQPDLRLYTLKLFKSQVPYCGRKWRQTNMRVITAIYLHCRPQLRDEWLCGGDVDGVVEAAVPVEQAGRALVHWWHLRDFRDVMEGRDIDDDGGSEENGPEATEQDEYDFFARELEKMGWGVGSIAGVEEEDMLDATAADLGTGVPPTPDFEPGMLRMDGWA